MQKFYIVTIAYVSYERQVKYIIFIAVILIQKQRKYNCRVSIDSGCVRENKKVFVLRWVLLGDLAPTHIPPRPRKSINTQNSRVSIKTCLFSVLSG